ncbi:aldehyde dehydrogenase [Flavobacteriaceae bacterium SZ-1-7]|uniref:aldehyde dehydrogenase n=1 Tax=Tamlana sedimenti TaxID=3134126 RepID=UPI0031246FEA
MNSIPEIIAAQKALFASQKTKDVNYRLQFLKALKAEILNKEQAVYDALKRDFNKSEFEAYLSEFGLVILELDLAIKNLKKWSKPERVKSSMLTFPSSDFIYKEPYGNVLVIAPWNYPFLLAMAPFIMAVAAGNTVVLKPSELTQNTSKLLVKIIENVFPEDLAKTVEGDAEIGAELLDQKWDYIFFTGSVEVGKIVAKAAAQNLTPVTLELGGKSPCIIDDSVDLKLTARRVVWGKYLNGGQTCIAPDYLLVKSNIKNDLIDALKAEIIAQYGQIIRNSEDFPQIIDNKNFERLKNLLKNETIVFGGEIDANEKFIGPTIMDQPDLDNPVMNEEIFGPLLPILTFENESDIEKVIWHFEKPLSLYVFSKNSNFTEHILKKYSFGGGVVNDVLIHFGNQNLPFGGVGASGMGKYHGKYGFDTFSHQKAIIKRGTWFDPQLRYAPHKNRLGIIKKMFKYFG